jgi:hydrogenase expression/formation protein HypC
MTEAFAPNAPCTGGHCITCSDEALAMTVLDVDAGRELALCEGDDGSRHSVEIALVAPVEPGDVLLVHAGTAIATKVASAIAAKAASAIAAPPGARR